MDRSSASVRLATAVVLVLLAGGAQAQGSGQGGVRTDCAKATGIERTICGNPELAAADRKLAAAYTSLVGKLSGPAKEHLLADQSRWLASRNSACVGEPAEIEECLDTRLRERMARLDWLGEGAYPFVSEQAIVKIGKARGIPYVVDASYPQFDANTADFTAVNRQLAAAAAEA